MRMPEVGVAIALVLATGAAGAGAPEPQPLRPGLAGGSGDTGSDPERAAIEKAVRASIGWALAKDRPLLERVLAHDADLFIFHPDSKSTVVGWDAFVKLFDVWMDPRFKATRFDIRELRITRSRSGDVAWFSAILDDCGEWDGKPSCWQDTRWTGVLEKREGSWRIVQMHFSFAADRAAGAGVKER